MIGYGDFVDRVDDWFVVADDAVEAAALLTGCRALDDGLPPTSFSVTFRTAPELPVEQGTYQLSAAGLGPEPVFLVPVEAVTDDPRFTAVFEAVFTTSVTTSTTEPGGSRP